MESLMTQLIYELEINKGCKKKWFCLFGVTSWKTQGRVTIKVHIYLLILFYSLIIFSVESH